MPLSPFTSSLRFYTVAALLSSPHHPLSSPTLSHPLSHLLILSHTLSPASNHTFSHLLQVLSDSTEDPITRHEAAEALGAVDAPESLAVLSRHASSPSSEVRPPLASHPLASHLCSPLTSHPLTLSPLQVADTCGLALALLEYEKGVCGCERRPQAALRKYAMIDAAIDETQEEVEPLTTIPSLPLVLGLLSPSLTFSNLLSPSLTFAGARGGRTSHHHCV